ncbi:hypothetical protein ACWGIV_33520, partial [Streptomyces sp. NPDC054844]
MAHRSSGGTIWRAVPGEWVVVIDGSSTLLPCGATSWPPAVARPMRASPHRSEQVLETLGRPTDD